VLLVLSVIVTSLSGSVVSTAQIRPGDERSQFRFEFKETEGRRGLGVEGWAYNGLNWRVTDVRLRVDCVNANGNVAASAAGWVLGDVLPGGRGYFFVPISSRAATYRVSVDSFHKVSREAP
jgi:hypothetical protein